MKFNLGAYELEPWPLKLPDWSMILPTNGL